MTKINIDDIIGNKYSRMTVVKFVGRDSYNRMQFECLCDCGNTKTVLYNNLRTGSSKSCGCIRIERLKKHGESTYKNGRTRLYSIWNKMKNRCYNANEPKYKNYGGRGITICDEWRNDFVAFRDWALQNGYNDKLSIDRIDVNGGYEPSNCQWATTKEQNRNKRNTVFVTYNGVKAPLVEWVERLGLSYSIVMGRLNKGWSVERAFTEPKKLYKKQA